MALGASRTKIAKMVLRETLVLVGLGIAVGIAAALATSRLILNLLYGVTPNNTRTCVIVCGTLAGVAVVAGYAPARHAMRVDPMAALRYE